MKSKNLIINLVFIKETKNEQNGKPLEIETIKKAQAIQESISRNKYFKYLDRNIQVTTAIRIRSSLINNSTTSDKELRYVESENIRYKVLSITKISGNYEVLDLQEVV